MSVDSIPSWITAYILLLIIFIVGTIYKRNIEKAKNYGQVNKFCFLIFLMIRWISKMSHQILGSCYVFAVPFFIYIIYYFWMGSILTIFGLPALGSNFMVPASVSLVVFFGTVFSGVYFKRWHYFDDFVVWLKFKNKRILPIPDPLKFVGMLSNVISLSCRLWGNCLAGSIILFLCYFSLDTLFTSINMEWVSILAIPSVVFPLHIYFDIVGGAIQSMIFMLLTMSYWAIAARSESHVSYGNK